MPLECSTGDDLLKSLNREQKRWYSETKTFSDSSQHTGRGFEKYWFCYGIKCYYFNMDRKTWSGCKQTCQISSLSLLKIDNEDELKFLQNLAPSDISWIGLSYDNKKKDWVWIDNGPSKLALNTTKYNIRDGLCMSLSKTRLDNGDCDKSYICICGTRLDKFPHWLSNECKSAKRETIWKILGMFSEKWHDRAEDIFLPCGDWTDLLWSPKAYLIYLFA